MSTTLQTQATKCTLTDVIPADLLRAFVLSFRNAPEQSEYGQFRRIGRGAYRSVWQHAKYPHVVVKIARYPEKNYIQDSELKIWESMTNDGFGRYVPNYGAWSIDGNTVIVVEKIEFKADRKDSYMDDNHYHQPRSAHMLADIMYKRFGVDDLHYLNLNRSFDGRIIVRDAAVNHKSDYSY